MDAEGEVWKARALKLAEATEEFVRMYRNGHVLVPGVYLQIVRRLEEVHAELVADAKEGR